MTPPSVGCPAVPAGVAATPGRRRLSRRSTLLLSAGAVFLVSNVLGVVYFCSQSSAQSPAPPAPAAGVGKTTNERLLETLGCQSAIHLYQTYLNVGLVAEAVEHETCTPAEGVKMLSTVAGLMDVVDRQLERLGTSGLSPQDKQDIEAVRAIAALLRVQLASLQAYWLSGDRRHADRYHEARKRAWEELGVVLGL
jgi:hypothetical protein